ncbi:hypothetical protein ACSBR1_014927 [Camellia fascicularis]
MARCKEARYSFHCINDGNPNNLVFGVEFDLFKSKEFNYINDNHVGLDVNLLTSSSACEASYYSSGGGGDNDENCRDSNWGANSVEPQGLAQQWTSHWATSSCFKELKLNNGKNYQVWIDYADFEINFAAVTGQLVQTYRILAWSFSNSNFSLSEALVTTGLPSFELPKSMTMGLFFVAVTSSGFSLLLINRKRRRERKWKIGDKGVFSAENVIGIGGNGKVYKGVLAGGVEVAVKQISHKNIERTREFLAENSSLGRLKHQNLDYMENGSLDKRVFECDDETKILELGRENQNFERRGFRVLYMHEGWEAKQCTT